MNQKPPSPNRNNKQQETQQSSPDNSSGIPFVAENAAAFRDNQIFVPHCMTSTADTISIPLANSVNNLPHYIVSSNQQAMLSHMLYANMLHASSAASFSSSTTSAIPMVQDTARLSSSSSSSQPVMNSSSTFMTSPAVFLPTVYQAPMIQAYIDPRLQLSYPAYSFAGHLNGLVPINSIGGRSFTTVTGLQEVMSGPPPYSERSSVDSEIDDSQRGGYGGGGGGSAARITTTTTTTSSSTNNDNETSANCNRFEIIEKPRRPLSAYNLFFRAERQRMIEKEKQSTDENRKRKRSGIPFEDMARHISLRWRDIDAQTLRHYQDLADNDKERYNNEMKRFNQQKSSEMTEKQIQLETTVPEEAMQRYLYDQAKKPKKKKTRQK